MTARFADPGRTLPWRQFYGLQIWRTMRKHQLSKEPLCVLCEQRGRVTPATVADHDPPHKGDYTACVTGHLRSLCKQCHDNLQSPNPRGYSCEIGYDGMSIDPYHPFNKSR
jgi:5-methylcytosine-specific restriction enzyme A